MKNYKNEGENEIAIRTIQHFLYCPHRWGLMEIEQSWAENYYVTKSDIFHKKVHNPDGEYSSRGKKRFTSVSVYNDLPQYNLYGVTDCIEIPIDSKEQDNTGQDARLKIAIVEYKPTKPKDREYNYEDLMQVFAQKICVDYVFGCDSDTYIHYGDVKKRYKLPIDTMYAELNQKLIDTLIEMRINLKEGIIPEIKKGQKCSGCSMSDLCMPKRRKRYDIRKEILKQIADD